MTKKKVKKKTAPKPRQKKFKADKKSVDDILDKRIKIDEMRHELRKADLDFSQMVVRVIGKTVAKGGHKNLQVWALCLQCGDVYRRKTEHDCQG